MYLESPSCLFLLFMDLLEVKNLSALCTALCQPPRPPGFSEAPVGLSSINRERACWSGSPELTYVSWWCSFHPRLFSQKPKVAENMDLLRPLQEALQRDTDGAEHSPDGGALGQLHGWFFLVLMLVSDGPRVAWRLRRAT